MQFTDFTKLDLQRLPSPCFVVDEIAIERNLAILNDVQVRSGAKVLQALKAFSMFELAPLSQQYLSGTCASGLHEARLGHEYYGGEVHVYSAAFSEADLCELLTFANHIVFNSPSQLLRFSDLCRAAKNQRPELQFGLRINPEHSEGAVEIYDPCAAGSRLGTTLSQLEQALKHDDFCIAFELVNGFHFHTLCEQGYQPLARTLNAIEERFAAYLPNLQWLNMGGGHHITAPGYDIESLINRIQRIRQQYDVNVYLEPGEAVAIGSGILSVEVLDITFNHLPQAILDTSATCHMPDTLEMPYRPDIRANHQLAGERDEFEYNYRLGGLTCLAGDVIGDYSFHKPLKVGQRFYFEDMAHYTMVKTTTFNGTRLPALAVWNSETDALRIVRQFSYDDFKMRLS